MFQTGFRLKLLFLFFSLLGIYFLEGNCQDNAQHPKITPIEEIEIFYANPECQQLQIASDPFDNQTAIWISQGVVFVPVQNPIRVNGNKFRIYSLLTRKLPIDFILQ